ncbi:hypothetical protein U1Q18_007932 [Sarracenia purpurea var. burkii]
MQTEKWGEKELGYGGAGEKSRGGEGLAGIDADFGRRRFSLPPALPLPSVCAWEREGAGAGFSLPSALSFSAGVPLATGVLVDRAGSPCLGGTECKQKNGERRSWVKEEQGRRAEEVKGSPASTLTLAADASPCHWRCPCRRCARVRGKVSSE